MWPHPPPRRGRNPLFGLFLIVFPRRKIAETSYFAGVSRWTDQSPRRDILSHFPAGTAVSLRLFHPFDFLITLKQRLVFKHLPVSLCCFSLFHQTLKQPERPGFAACFTETPRLKQHWMIYGGIYPHISSQCGVFHFILLRGVKQ